MWKQLLIGCLALCPIVATAQGISVGVGVGRNNTQVRNYPRGRTRGRVYIIRRGPVRYEFHPVDTAGVSLVTQPSVIEPGEPFQIHVVFHVPKNTFVYWEGDAFSPPIDWDLPSGFDVRRLSQSPAESFTINEERVYGYTYDRTVTYEITAPDDLEAGEGLIIDTDIEVTTCDGLSCHYTRYEPKAFIRVK